MSETLYIVDAMAFAFRAFYAIGRLSDVRGRPTHAIYGLARVLMKLAREHRPDYLAVVFDAPGPTFREERYAAYKANRDATPEDLLEQFPRMHELVRAMGLPLFCVEGVEADDVIGTLAEQARMDGIEVVIVSGDKDLMQLVGDRVRMFDPGRDDLEKWYGPAEVLERFGTLPERVPDALGLIGDASDNIPGVKGIGEKTARELMQAYGSLENLYAHLEEIKGKKREYLDRDRENAFLSRELATIRRDIPLPMGPRDCRPTPPDPDVLRALFAELGFRSLLPAAELEPRLMAPEAQRETPGADAEASAVQGMLFPETDRSELDRDYRLVTTEAELREMIDELRLAACIAVDTETTSTDPMSADLVGISFSREPYRGWYVPVGHRPEALWVHRNNGQEAVSQLPARQVLGALKPLLEADYPEKCGHNIKYDMIVLANAGISLGGVTFDSMIASYLTDGAEVRLKTVFRGVAGDEGVHPCAAAFVLARVPVRVECSQLDAVRVADGVVADRGVPRGRAFLLFHADAVKARGDFEHSLDDLLQREVGAQRLLVEIEERGALFLGVVSQVPRREFGRAGAFQAPAELQQLAVLLLVAGLGLLLEFLQEFQRLLAGARHAVGQGVIRKVLITEQLSFFPA